MSDYNERNESWNNEQAPFAGAETPAEVRAATAEAAAAPETGQASQAAAGAASAGYAQGTYGAPGASGTSSAAGPAGWRPVSGYAGPMPPAGAIPVAVPAGVPNPMLAFFLGLIPGVGAMYNGQVAKGFVHLIVFAVLVTIANSVDVFGIFVAGWIFFMAFEAYHTAKARRDGLPLPNAFGWNDIGERVGLGKNWPASPGAPSYTPAAGAPQGVAPATPPSTSPAGWSNVPPGSQSGSVPFPGGYAGTAPYANPVPNWAGYVPPTAFPGGPAPVSAAVPGGAVPPGVSAAYAPVHGTEPYGGVPAIDPAVATSSRLPVGAIWLIGLGVLFLVGQWTPLLHWSHVWVPSLLLAGLAVFLFARRMGWTGTPVPLATAGLPLGLRAAMALRAPGALLAIALLNGLDQAWVVRWNRSWPVLLIVVGALMLVERAAWRQAAALDLATEPTDPATKGGF
jgi:TM2 domain-containing membrane protein YozV